MLKCISWCQQAFHTIWDNMWVGLRIGITIPPVYLCYFHSLSIPNLLVKPNVLYAVSNQNVILFSNVNEELEISKRFLIEQHQCLNTFAQDNILKLENFRFYIFDLLLFLLGHLRSTYLDKGTCNFSIFLHPSITKFAFHITIKTRCDVAAGKRMEKWQW